MNRHREARNSRIDAAVADIYDAQDERAQAIAFFNQAEARIGQAMLRLQAEGLTTAWVAQLLDVQVGQVQRFAMAASAEPETNATTYRSKGRRRLGPAGTPETPPGSGTARVVAEPRDDFADTDVPSEDKLPPGQYGPSAGCGDG